MVKDSTLIDRCWCFTLLTAFTASHQMMGAVKEQFITSLPPCSQCLPHCCSSLIQCPPPPPPLWLSSWHNAPLLVLFVRGSNAFISKHPKNTTDGSFMTHPVYCGEWPNYLWSRSHEGVHGALCFSIRRVKSACWVLKIWPLPTHFAHKSRAAHANAALFSQTLDIQAYQSTRGISFFIYSVFSHISSLDLTSCPAPSCAWSCFVTALCLRASGAINYMSSALLTRSSLPSTCWSRSPPLLPLSASSTRVWRASSRDWCSSRPFQGFYFVKT